MECAHDEHSKASPSNPCPCVYWSDDQRELRQTENRGVATPENKLHSRGICFYSRQQKSLPLVLEQETPLTDESGPEVSECVFGRDNLSSFIRDPISSSIHNHLEIHPTYSGYQT